MEYSTNSNNSSNNNTNGTASRKTQNANKSFLPEKFSKIFKKNKKTKSTIPTKKEAGKRKLSWDNSSSLPTTPDSLDSDYEDNRMNSTTTSASVKFQTQTRASYRSRSHTTRENTEGEVITRKLLKMGSKRRKCLQPRKNRRTIDNVQFFDELEWKKVKTCCGTVYECPNLNDAIIIDMDYYNPCAEHQKREAVVVKPIIMQQQKSIITTIPAVVQLATSLPSTSSVTATTTSANITNAIVNTNPTPVLKKHHLFFKRQSESFPHGDININNIGNSNTNNITTTTFIKTESLTPATINNISTITSTATMHGNGIQTTALNNMNGNHIPTISISNSVNATANISTTNMPRHSTAKITTITPLSVSASLPITPIQSPIIAANTTIMPINKSQNFLHKIKSDTGKIVKHSLEKLNTAVRIKPSDLNDIKNVIKTVDKSYVLAKPTTITPVIANYQSHHVSQQPLTTVTLSAAGCSPNSVSSSSSSSTKFSDNSSDSGFDENMQDRKSASPLQEDTDKKIVQRPNVQTMFLSNGVQIHGQTQNVLLAGNEVAAKILQSRRQQQAIATIQQTNSRSHATSTTTGTTVKIAQIVAGNSGNGGIGGSHAKMRAIYNSNNTIQHENGITTIVPASSLAATSQTIAMNAVAPSTVTITPAPVGISTLGSNNSSNGKKLTNANIIGINSNNNLGNTGANNNLHQHHYQQTQLLHSQAAIHPQNISGAHLATITSANNVNNNNNSNNNNNNNNNSISSANLNQKIILVKAPINTAKYTNNSNNNNNNIIINNIINQATITATSNQTTIPTAVAALNITQGACKK